MAQAKRSLTGYKSETPQERHDRRFGWFLFEAGRQAKNRQVMAMCERYYDNEQYTVAEAEKIRARGQEPVTYNEIAAIIDYMIGVERRQRVDFYVIAEDDDPAAEEDARVKTKLLKYLDETNRAAFERSYAAEDMFKAGMGWLEVGLRRDQNGVKVAVTAERWRNMLWDSVGGHRMDMSDGRYKFRIKVVDLDTAIALFPEKRRQLEAVAQEGDDLQVIRDFYAGAGIIGDLDVFNGVADSSEYMVNSPTDLFNVRKRVLLLECWSREPVMQPEPVHGLQDPVTFKMHLSIMTEKDTLLEGPSPYNHDMDPFIPLWAYRKSSTGLPYSPILRLIGPQDSLNDRMSLALFEAASNQLEIEEGAINNEVMTVEQIHDELNDPLGIAVYANGALSGSKVRKRDSKESAQMQMTLAANDRMVLRSMVGTDDRGADTSNMSGKARLVKQDQTGIQTAQLYDNLLLARQMEGDLTLSVAEQFMVHPFTIRVAGDAGKYERTKVNQPNDQGGYDNDITTRKAHFVVGEQAWKQSFAESTFESLMQVLTQLASASPQVVVALLDVVFDMHPNLPRKQAVLKRIRAVNGQADEDGNMTPEQQAEMQQKQQVAKAQFEQQMAQIQASIKESQAKGEKIDAEAMLSRINSLRQAAETAAMLAPLAGTGVVAVADEILKSAGFQDKTPEQPAFTEPQAMPVQPMAQDVPQPTEGVIQ